MALNFGKGNRSIAFAPTAAFPLNANSYFESYDLALAAALTAKPAGDTTTKYYFGQEIAVAEMIDNVPQSAKLYIIAPEVQEDGSVVGTLQEVGSATNGDGKSIELVDGVLSVKDFGKRYYKYVAAVEGGEAAHYEVTEGWVAGLEPKVVLDGEDLVIGWYEPNPTTAEGVKDQVVEVQGEVEQAKEDINSLDEILNGTEENPGGLVGTVNDINETLYGSGEGEEVVSGLVERVGTLETNVSDLSDAVDNRYTKSEVYNKNETYTQGEVDTLISAAISGVFHFRGVVDTYDNLPVEKAEGDVYQVGEKEYAWNGTEWVELGFLIDLSPYVTTEAFGKAEDNIAENAENIGKNAQAITALQGADTAIGERIDSVEDDVSALVEEDERLAGLIDGHDDRIETLETAKTGFDTHFETVDGQIKALQEADTAFDGRLTTVEGFETRIGTLEGYVGTPTGNLGALYPAVESLNQRLNDIVAEGGEPNQLNGISISGTLVPVNDGLIAELPIFIGSTAGLVPVAASELTANHILNAKGNWIDVAAMIDNKIEEALTWDSIVE